MDNEEIIGLKEDADKIVSKVATGVEEALTPKPRNRAERRAQEKLNRRGYRKDIKHLDNISEAAKKMVFAELITSLRKMNEEKKGNNENDSTKED